MRKSMSTEFLQTGLHNLCQVAALVLLGDTDGFLNLSFLEAAGNGGGKFTRLFSGLAEGNVAVDHHADGTGGHDWQQNEDDFCHPSHVCPHGTQLEADLALEEDRKDT